MRNTITYTDSHTPAPWVICDSDPFNICTTEGHAIADIAQRYSSISNNNEHKANVRLIVKAPTLLEALKKIYEYEKKRLEGELHLNPRQMIDCSAREWALEAIKAVEGK